MDCKKAVCPEANLNAFYINNYRAKAHSFVSYIQFRCLLFLAWVFTIFVKEWSSLWDCSNKMTPCLGFYVLSKKLLHLSLSLSISLSLSLQSVYCFHRFLQ